MSLLEYLNKYAQKAYREISSIIYTPDFLFSNDPNLKRREGSLNYRYIHGFNRLIKKNRITIEILVNVFEYLGDEIEKYLKKYYKNKNFVLYINGDALIPAFTLTIISHYDDKQLEDCFGLDELIVWYKDHACFDGLVIIENESEELETKEESIEEEYPDSSRTYSRLITT
jgi:hypothetical protein